MMRLATALLATAALGVAFSASAADVPVRAPVYKAPAPVVAYNWSGFYIGGHAGYGWMDSTDRLSDVTGATLVASGAIASSIPLDPKGFVGGGQIGYNWQIAPMWVFGLEADISWTDFDETASLPGPADPSRIVTAHQKLDWFGTVRGRLGVTPTDRWLAYVTGGFAYGRGSLSTALTRTTGCAGANNCQQGSVSDTLTGWTVGGGLEWALANNWSVKAEYLYFDLGSLSHLMTDPFFPLTTFRASTDFKGHIIRAGINYKLDWGGAR